MYFAFTEGTADLVAIRITSVRINGVLMYFAFTEGTADLVAIRITSVRISGVLLCYIFCLVYLDFNTKKIYKTEYVFDITVIVKCTRSRKLQYISNALHLVSNYVHACLKMVV